MNEYRAIRHHETIPAYNMADQARHPLTSQRPKDYGPPRMQITGPEGGYSVFDLQQQTGPRDRGYDVWQITDMACPGSEDAHLLEDGMWSWISGTTQRNRRATPADCIASTASIQEVPWRISCWVT